MKNESIRLEKNENGHGWQNIYVNGVSISISHHEDGTTTMYVHSNDNKLDIKIADAKVTRKTHRTPCEYTGETKWVTLKVDGTKGDEE
jgi:predicted aspartyl protease